MKDIALRYINAGSDIIETNSFGANSIRLDQYNLSSSSYRINYEAARISRAAAGESRLVMGSIGPTGKILLMGDISEQELYDSFSEQAKALEQGGADALIIETMSDIEEARIALRAVQEHTCCDIVVSFTFSKTADNFRTMMGISPQDVMNEFSSYPNIIIGTNCGNGVRNIISIAEIMAKLSSERIIMVQPNAGNPVYMDGKTVFPESPEEMVSCLPELIQCGVKIIGGAVVQLQIILKPSAINVDHIMH